MDYNDSQTALLAAVLQSNNESLVSALIDAGANVNETDDDGLSALFYAVLQSNNESVVRALIDAGANVNKTNENGQTAFFYAVQDNKNESVVRALIDAGAQVNKTENHGQTALSYAVQQSNNESVVRAIVDAGVDVNKTDNDGKTALFCLAPSNNTSVARILINAGADVNITSNDGQTPLFHVVHQSNSETLVQALIDAGADVNKTDIDGQTALFHAIQQSNNEVVRALIDAGADINKTDNDGRTALLYAALPKNSESDSESVVRLLIDAGADVNKTDDNGVTTLFIAVYYSNNEVVRALIDAGADINKTDKDGRTALLYAALQKNSESVVRLLIDAGANVNKTDDDGVTTLFIAVYHSNNEVVRALIDAGADINKTDNDGRTALFYAALQKNSESDIESVVRLLIDAGANVNKTDDDGVTTLFIAVYHSNNEVVRALIDAGADINKTDNDGQTALFYAIQQSNNEVVRALIDAGADVNTIRTDGKTALLHAVRQSNNESVACALVEAGADVNITHDNGKTPLFWAVQQSNNEGVVRALIGAGTAVNYADYDGETALFYAVKQSQNENVVRTLMKAGADINKSGFLNQTPLMYAVKQGNNEMVVRAFIDAGVDVNKVDDFGQTALIYAIKYSKKSLVRLLIDAGAEVNTPIARDGTTALIYAVQKCNDEILVRALTDAGADVNKTNEYGRTALFYAIQQNNNEGVFRALIVAGGDMKEFKEYGRTALFQALHQEDERFVSALVHAGVDVTKADVHGKTALFYAIQQSNESIVRALIDAGADINVIDDNNKTVLIYAVQQRKNGSMIDVLIKSGAQVNITDDDGQTALFYAVQQSNNESVVRALIDAGTEVNETNKYGQTALFYAVQEKYNESVFYGLQQSRNLGVVRALIDAGADVKISDEYGQTALSYAVQESKNESVVCALIESCNDILTLRDICGRTALFYAHWSYFTTGSFIFEEGASRCLQFKDNCNVHMLTLLIEEYCTSRIQKFDTKVLMKHGVKRESLVTTVLNVMFRKSITYSSSVHEQESFLKLAHLYGELSIDGSGHSRNLIIDEIVFIMLLKEDTDKKTKALELLGELGANSDSADSDGNTALHHTVHLPFLGASEEHVMGLCHQLENLGAQFNTRNHQNQTPLLFCLSGDISRLTQRELPTAFETVRKVCIFLLKRGSVVLEETSRTGESVFHLILKIFQVGLELRNKEIRQKFLQEVIELLQLFTPTRVFIKSVVNKSDIHLDTPLHLWANLAFKLPEDYYRSVIEDCSFEEFLNIVFNHLLRCGAKPFARNENESTPLHMCKTWSAVKVLLKAGASPNDRDAKGQTPLLVAAKNRGSAFRHRDRFYPDVSEDPKQFWKNCITKGLDLWAVDKHGESVMSILIQSETFVLAKAMIDVTCEMSYTQSETVTTDLLNAICKDKSTRTHWKAVLVQDILKSRRCTTTAATPLRFCCENVIAEAKYLLHGPELYSTVHCEILKLLRSFGAYSESCLDMAETCPALKYLLTKPVDIDMPVLVPWTSVSKKHEDKLAKVARRQECDIVGQFWFHNDYIGRGSFGHVFAGINDKDGREVAIKRIEKLRMQRPQDKREITNLTALADCEQVLRYLQFFDDDDGKFSYVILELMEGNLDDYLTGSTHDNRKDIELCGDIIKGLEYLHKENILHRDLKPRNILYKVHPKLCLKIADFGLSRRIDVSDSTVYGTNAGTRCWIAPEVLVGTPKDHSKSSDMFSCGLVLHYILSVQKHPFSRNNTQPAHEVEVNIANSKMEGWDNSLFSEASQLVRNILESGAKNRPTAEQALNHPMLWSKSKKIDFLAAVGNQSVFEYPRVGRTICFSAIEADLETNFSTIVRKGAWNDPGYTHMPVIFAEMTKKRNYDVHSAVELVRFIRNLYSHVSEDTRPTVIRKLLLEDFVILEYFPNLVMEVYKVVIAHGWDQTKEEIKYSMNK